MKQLKEDLNNQTFHPVYLLYGEEDYLKRMYRDRLKKAVLGDGDEMNYSYFEGKDIDFPTLREAAKTLPFFSDHRIIIIENSRWFKNASELADYLPAMPDTTVMVFVEKEIDKRNKLYKYVNKNGLAVEMTTMTERELKAWVALLLKQSGRKIQESTASYLLEQVDNSMTNIKNELDKLIAYTEGREIITKEDIDAVCSIQVTGRIFQMMDAVASGNQGETLRLYHDLLTLRENPMSILYLLTRHFNVLLQVKGMTGKYDRAEMAKKAGIPPFAVGKYQSQCRRFSGSKIKTMLDSCIETEYQLKRGKIGDKLGVELLLISFAEIKKT